MLTYGYMVPHIGAYAIAVARRGLLRSVSELKEGSMLEEMNALLTKSDSLQRLYAFAKHFTSVW